MKKLLVIALGAMMIFSVAAVSMASTIKTTGEFDFDYFGQKTGSGAPSNTTLAEVGLYNNIAINDNISAYLGFWLETDNSAAQGYNIIDDAFVNFKLGANNLKVGYGKYNYYGPFDVLGNNGFLQNLMGNVEPDVQVVFTAPIGDAFTAKVGYFRDPAGVGNDIASLAGSYAAGPIFADATYFAAGKANGQADAPAGQYLVDGGYKFGENYKVYAGYVGVDQTTDATKTDNYALVGASAKLFDKLFLEAEYGVSVPDTFTKASNGDDMAPFGAVVSYQFDPNASLKFTRAVNTGFTNSEYDRLQLIVTF